MLKEILFVSIIVILLVLIFGTDYGKEPYNVNSTRQVKLHYVDWCPYCQHMKPVWSDVKASLLGSGIQFIEVNEDITKTSGIESYPTIIMVAENGKSYSYKGLADKEQLRNWIIAINPSDFRG